MNPDNEPQEPIPIDPPDNTIKKDPEADPEVAIDPPDDTGT